MNVTEVEVGKGLGFLYIMSLMLFDFNFAIMALPSSRGVMQNKQENGDRFGLLRGLIGLNKKK